MKFKSHWWFLILEFKSFWGCQISGFKSLCPNSRRRLKAFAGNPAEAAGAHNKIPALNCIKLTKQNYPSLFRIIEGSYKYIYKKDNNGDNDVDEDDDGGYQFSVKRHEQDQITPLQYFIRQSSISKDVIQELEATFDRTSFK